MVKISKLARGIVLAMIVCGMGLCLSPVNGADEPWKPTGKETPASMKARASTINRPKEVGKYYEATVPDTLDLAERAWLGINNFTSIISEKDDYEMYWRADFYSEGDLWAWPGYMVFQMSMLQACEPKSLEAMAMERLESGSQQNLEREAKMMEMLVSHLGDDGLFYVLPSGGRKPWLGPEEMRPYAHVNGQVRMLRAMIAWYQYTGDPEWKNRIDRMVDGLDRIAVHKDDYAYFPIHGLMPEDYLSSCYVKGRGWKDTSEPENEKGGEEGSLFIHQGEMPGPLANWYVLTGNKQALRLSGELVRFLTKPKFWADWKGGEYPGVVGAEHAHWRGHYHGHMYVLRAVLEYAIAANDSRLKQFVRDGYEWTRQAGFARIGLMADGEGCGCARAIALAVKLTDAGVGDYWEDVDLYIRNHGSEMQFTPDDVPHIQELLKKNPNPAPPPDFYAYVHEHMKHPKGLPEGTVIQRAYGTDVGVLEASIGAFGFRQKTGWAKCCAQGNMGSFYVWDGTLRYADGVARINFLLNRASPWMEIDSSIPYEGKVVLRNKTAREAFVRIPLYVDKGTVNCRIGNRAVRPEWFGRYLRIENLKAGDVVTIEFPLEERIERWTAPPNANFTSPLPGGTIYTCKFRGNTLIELSPPFPGTWLYQGRAEKYQTAKAPMKKVVRYVTSQTFQW